MLRNPAYQGTACFQKTRQAERQRMTRRLRQRGGIAPRLVCSRPRPRTEWIAIAVPALITPTQFTLAQERFDQNRRFAARHTCVHGITMTEMRTYAKVGLAEQLFEDLSPTPAVG